MLYTTDTLTTNILPCSSYEPLNILSSVPCSAWRASAYISWVTSSRLLSVGLPSYGIQHTVMRNTLLELITVSKNTCMYNIREE